MTLQGHFGLSQRVKAPISRVAAFKELINAKLSTDHSGESTVSGAGVTEVKISKILQEGTYPLSYYTRTTVPSATHHTRNYSNILYYINTAI